MAPKQSQGGRAAAGTAPTRWSARIAANAPSNAVQDDPERILRNVRRGRGGRAAATRGRGGHRETGGLRPPLPSPTSRDGTSRDPLPSTSRPTVPPIPPPHSEPTPPATPQTEHDRADGEAGAGTEISGTAAGPETATTQAGATVSATDIAGAQAGETGTALDATSAQIGDTRPVPATTGSQIGETAPAPESSERDAEKGPGDQGETSHEGTSGGAEDIVPSKRSRQGSDEDGRETKRVRSSPDGSTDPGTAREHHTPPPADPCADFRAAWSELGPAIATSAEGLSRPAFRRDFLDLNTAFRAIAAVTEAIAENGGPQFSLLDPIYTHLRDRPQRVVRRGRDMLCPFGLGRRAADSIEVTGGHLALFIFRAATRDEHSFAVDYFDSAPPTDPDVLAEVQNAYETARGILLDNEWMPDADFARANAPPIPTMRPAPRQENGWVCGFHAVFTAWAHALGLTAVEKASFPGELYEYGVSMINLAMHGRISSQMIRNFLACHGFIQPGSVVPHDRVINRTMPLETNMRFSEYIARIRLEEDLDDQRRTDDATPNLDAALTMIGEGTAPINNDALFNTSVETLLREYRLATTAPGDASSTTHATRSEGGAETTRPSPAGPSSAIHVTGSEDGAETTSLRPTEGSSAETRGQSTGSSLGGAQTAPSAGGEDVRALGDLQDSTEGQDPPPTSGAREGEDIRRSETMQGGAGAADTPGGDEGSGEYGGRPEAAPAARATALAKGLLALFPNLPELQNEHEVRQHYDRLSGLTYGAPRESDDEPPPPRISPPPPSPPTASAAAASAPSTSSGELPTTTSMMDSVWEAAGDVIRYRRLLHTDGISLPYDSASSTHGDSVGRTLGISPAHDPAAPEYSDPESSSVEPSEVSSVSDIGPPHDPPYDPASPPFDESMSRPTGLPGSTTAEAPAASGHPPTLPHEGELTGSDGHAVRSDAFVSSAFRAPGVAGSASYVGDTTYSGSTIVHPPPMSRSRDPSMLDDDPRDEADTPRGFEVDGSEVASEYDSLFGEEK